MSIDIAKELVDRHDDKDIINHLDSVMTGLLQNYKTAVKANQPQILFGNLGDVSLVAQIIRAMKKRNDEVEARKNL